VQAPLERGHRVRRCLRWQAAEKEDVTEFMRADIRCSALYGLVLSYACADGVLVRFTQANPSLVSSYAVRLGFVG
jgi:hypothetical protein